MIEEAQAHFSSGNFAAAEPLYRKMLEEEPDNPQALVNMGIAVLEQSRAGEAIAWLQPVFEALENRSGQVGTVGAK